MKARVSYRRLFTTTSFAALLATTSGVFSSGAMAGTTYNSPTSNEVYNSGGLTDFISIETTLSNEDGIDGLIISGANNGAYEVTNVMGTGFIDVSDTALNEEALEVYDGSLNGIHITDGGVVTDTIRNSGWITVLAELTAGVTSEEASLFRDAAGIRVDESANVTALISNVAYMDVDAVAGLGLESADPQYQNINTGASAYGVDFNGLGASFLNRGSIDVQSQSGAFASTFYDNASYDEGEDGEDGEDISYGETYARAQSASKAVGAHFLNPDDEFGTLVGDVTNGYLALIQAQATGTAGAGVSLDLQCDFSSEEECTSPAYATGAAIAKGDVRGYGIEVGINTDDINEEGVESTLLADSGGFYNNGTITGKAVGVLNSRADIVTDGNFARAGAGRSDDYMYEDGSAILTRGIGVAYGVDDFGGSFINDTTIEGHTETQATSYANATADYSAQAGAFAAVDTKAKGVELHAHVIDGNFGNSGRIAASYDVLIGSADTEDESTYYTPMSANAHGGDEAYARTNVFVNASATGIEIQGTSMTDDFVLGGGDNETDGVYATGTLHSELKADANAYAGGSLSEGAYADASAAGGYNSDVAGVEFYVTNLSGQFINEGTVSAVSHQSIAHEANARSFDESNAEVDASISANATGIHIESQSDKATTISGNIYNTGDVSADVSSVFEGSANADGSGDLRAQANADMTAKARGMDLHVGKLQDNFYNDGTITAQAQARRDIAANANADREEEGGDYAYAEAYAGNTYDIEESSYVSAEATGLNLLLTEVNGHIENEGNVDVTANASDIVSANARAGDDGDAYAYAQSGLWANGTGIYIETSGVGTGLEYVENVDESDGYIYNGGDITVAVTGYGELNALANAIEGSAVAEAHVDGSAEGDGYSNVSAFGLVFENNEGYAEIAGAVVNDGNINVQASLDATVNAGAYNSGDDTEDNLAAALAGGENGVYAAGIVISGYDIGVGEDEGGFWNGGDVTVAASALQNTSAEATSLDGVAVAMIGSDISRYDYNAFDMDAPNYVRADSEGISLRSVDVEGSFGNYADVSARSFAGNNNRADADGEKGALASLYARTEARSVGLNAVDVNIDGGGEDGALYNGGSFYAEAAAYSNNEAEADSDEGSAEAYIGLFDNDEEGSDSLYTNATATGVRMASGYGYDFVNDYDGELTSDLDDIFGRADGVIGALAVAQSTNYAHADADEGGAIASVSQRDFAHAAGVEIHETEDGTGGFYNDGAIYAIAGAGNVTQQLGMLPGFGADNTPEDLDFRQEAYANSDEGTASASVDYAAGAEAAGADVWVRSFDNDGIIGGFAAAISSGYAHADASDGGDHAYAGANVYADAQGTGANVHMRNSNGDLVNSGAIIGVAQAYAYAEAKIDGDEGSEAHAAATAEADAYGLVVGGSSIIDTISNLEGGVISAQADSSAETRVIYNDDGGETEEGPSASTATGFLAQGVNFMSLENGGTISANADAGDTAQAIGLSVDGYASYSYSGSIVNSGTIEAFARADNARATGILLTNDARVSSITNTGTISAESEDTSDFDLLSMDLYGRAIAIDIRGAGVPVQINQNGGEVDGAIVMENSQVDHLDWKGGEINGDIFGDYEQDVINIYASTVGETTYNNFTYDHIIDGADSVSVNGGDRTDAVTLRITNQIRNVASVNVGANATLNLSTHATIDTDALNLNAGSTLKFDINDTDEAANGTINTGTANLGGATVKAAFVSPWNRTTNAYRIINWNEESDTTFAHVISSDVLTKVTAQYGEDGVDLLMQYLNFGDLTYLEDDATSLGLAFDRTWNQIDPDSPIGQALQQLLQLTPDQFAYEMSQIAGQQTADIQHVTVAQLGSLIHVIQTQINEARTLSGGTGGDGLSFSVGSDKMKFSSGDDFKPLGGASAGDPVMQGDWRAWARVFGDWAELKASNTAPGFKSDAAGVVVGADYAPSNGLTMGLAGGYQSSDMTFGGQGKGDITSWSVTAYADYEFGNAYIDGLVGYAAQSYDMDRYLSVLGTNYVANAQYDGGAVIGAIEAGYKFDIGNAMTLTPFAGLNTTHTTTDGSTETGAGVWNISYDDRSDTQVDSVLGARLSKDFKTDGGMLLTPTIELGWKHGFGDTSPTAGASMAGIPGSQYTIFGSEMKADSAIVGASLQAQLTDTVDAYVQYNGQYSSDYSDNTASLRLRLKF